MHFLHVTTVSTAHAKRMSATVLIALTADCTKGRSRFSQRRCQRVTGGECLGGFAHLTCTPKHTAQAVMCRYDTSSHTDSTAARWAVLLDTNQHVRSAAVPAQLFHNFGCVGWAAVLPLQEHPKEGKAQRDSWDQHAAVLPLEQLSLCTCRCMAQKSSSWFTQQVNQTSGMNPAHPDIPRNNLPIFRFLAW